MEDAGLLFFGHTLSLRGEPSECTHVFYLYLDHLCPTLYPNRGLPTIN